MEYIKKLEYIKNNIGDLCIDEISIDISLGTKKGNNITALFISILDKEVIEKAKQYDVIVFDYNFTDNTNLINYLPSNIKYIIFDYESYFDKPIYNYPLSLEYIKFGMYFNQSIDYLPPTLKYLILGEYFNQNLNNIPISIEYLSLEIMFNNPIDNLSDNIKVLYLYSNNENFPISSNNGHFPIRKLPKNLEKIQIYTCKDITLDNNCFVELNNLNEIDLRYGFNSSLDNIKWSDSIKILKLGGSFNQRLDNLPKYLESIEVSMDFDLFVNIRDLPTTLKEFIYNDDFPLQCINKKNRLKELEALFPNIKFIHR
jgi:hypothetical protein